MAHYNRNLKAGDICTVVRCKTNPRYVGMSVELLKALSPGEYFSIPDANIGFKGSSTPIVWVVKGGPFTHVFDMTAYQSAYGSFGEHCLMKISGDPDQPPVMVERVLDKSYQFTPVKEG